MHLRFRKRVLSPICRRLLRDDDRDVSRAILIVGAPRSGTTWLAELLEAAMGARLMFEPFHPAHVPEFAAFTPFHYARAGDDDRRLIDCCRRVFDGSLRNSWIDKNVTALRPRSRIVKSVRSNLMFAWLAQRFPEVPRLFVLRHPCAVVMSRMHYGWTADDDLAALLGQPRLVEDFLSSHLDLIHGARTVEEKHAILWCVTNLVPLRQVGYRTLAPLHYEHLYARGPRVLSDLAAALGRDIGSLPAGANERPSRTTTARSPVMRRRDNLRHWQAALPADSVSRILDVVAAFGLEWLYGADAMPRTVAGSRRADDAPEDGNPCSPVIRAERSSPL